MQLPSSLLKDFARVTNDNEKAGKSLNAYGDVIKTGDDMYVKLDGTEELTPVVLSMDAEDGDRVLVSIEKHLATIIGNITCPASARTATNFMKLTEDGLVVGALDKEGNPTGTYSMISPGVYYILAQNGSELASFSADEIKLGNGKASFTSDKITLGNGMATFTTDKITLGNGMAVFTTESISLGNGNAFFSKDEINLGNGKVVIKPGEITLGSNGEAVFTPTKVSLSNGAAVFSADQINLANGMTVINSTKVSLANGAAVFTTDKITLGNGMAVIGLNEISLANGAAVFSENRISLGNGKAVFTGDSISLGSEMLVISTTQISLAKGKSTFSESQISLLDGQATITANKISLGNGMAVIGTDSITLANGKAVFASDYISLDNDSVRIESNTIRLGKDMYSTINLCNGNGLIFVDNDGTMVLKGSSASGLSTIYNNDYRSEVVAKCTSGVKTAAMQVYQGSNSANTASIVVSLSNGIAMTTPSGKAATINGHEFLHTYNLMTDGKITLTGSIPAGQRLKFTRTLTLPSGYSLVGIRQVTTSYPKKCCITGFFTNPSVNEIGVSIYNMTNETLDSLKVYIEWFGFHSWTTLSNGETTVTWGSESIE